MVLGLMRHLALVFWEAGRVYYRAGDRKIPFHYVWKETLKWLVPLKRIKQQFAFSVTSIVFHIAIILTPIFLAGHIVLWQKGTGFGWPAISNAAADFLTVTAILTGLALLAQRLAASATRSISRLQDYLLPLLIVVPFCSGFLIMHPDLNPFSYQAVFLVHILSGNLILILIPITKLSHVAIFPETQLISELAWHWPADAGSRVGKTLRKENLPI